MQHAAWLRCLTVFWLIGAAACVPAFDAPSRPVKGEAAPIQVGPFTLAELDAVKQKIEECWVIPQDSGAPPPTRRNSVSL